MRRAVLPHYPLTACGICCDIPSDGHHVGNLRLFFFVTLQVTNLFKDSAIELIYHVLLFSVSLVFLVCIVLFILPALVLLYSFNFHVEA